MNSPISLYSVHSRLVHTAILTNLGCLPRPVSWEDGGSGRSTPILTSGQSLVYRDSQGLLVYPYRLARPLF